MEMVWQAENGQTSSDHKLERWAGGEAHTQTPAENGMVIVSTAVLAKREILSNKIFMIFFLSVFSSHLECDTESHQDQRVEWSCFKSVGM